MASLGIVSLRALSPTPGGWSASPKPILGYSFLTTGGASSTSSSLEMRSMASFADAPFVARTTLEPAPSASDSSALLARLDLLGTGAALEGEGSELAGGGADGVI